MKEHEWNNAINSQNPKNSQGIIPTAKVMRKGEKDSLAAPLLNPLPGFGITINVLSIFNDQENHQNITVVTVYKCK